MTTFGDAPGAAPGAKYDPRLQDVVLVDQLPSDMWTEGIAIRPSGNILTTRIEEPDLFAINTASAGPLESEFDSVAPQLVHTFPNANGSFNICALKGTKREEYAVTTGFSDLAQGQFHSWAVWRVVMPPEDSDEKPEASKITDVPLGGFLMGMEAISERNIAICDAVVGCIWRIDVNSGEVSKLAQEPAMTPPGVGDAGIFGCNRARFTERHGWFINTALGTFYRFPIEWTDDGLDVQPTGPAEELASGLANADGLTMTRDGKSAYICSYTSGHLWRVDTSDEECSGEGQVNVVRKDLVSPTGMELVYNSKHDKPTLYIVCCGEVSADVIEGDRGQWVGLANVDVSKLQIKVTVTTEVTYEYI